MPSGAKKRKAAKRKKGMASAADHPLQDNGHHDDLGPSDDAKECVGGSTTSSASSSPRENGCSRSAAQVLLGSDSVMIDSTAEGDKEVVLPQVDEENTSVVLEVSSAATAVSFAEPEGSFIESTKSGHEDDKSADRLVVPVDKIIALAEEGEQGVVLAPESLEDASNEAQIKSDRVVLEFVDETSNQVEEKASLFPDADEAMEMPGENLEDHRCLAGKAELSAEPDDSIIELAKSDQDDLKTTDELAISLAEEGCQGNGVGHGILVEEAQDTGKAMEKLDVQHEDPSVASKAEILVAAEVPPSHATPVGAQWWNCCGLLDLFAKSGR